MSEKDVVGARGARRARSATSAPAVSAAMSPAMPAAKSALSDAVPVAVPAAMPPAMSVAVSAAMRPAVPAATSAPAMSAAMSPAVPAAMSTAPTQTVVDAGPDVDPAPGVGGSARGPSLRLRVGVGAAIVLVVVALVASVLITALSPTGSTTVFDARGGAASPAPSTGPPVSPPAASSSGAGAADSRATVLVHLLGAVAHPGVYELAEGSRVVDAIGRAGGFAADADQASVNLARALTDGEQLRVLAVGEAPPVAAAPGGGTGSGGGGPGAGSGAGGGAGSGGAAGGAAPLVNLNSATEFDLDALPRIGPAMAARIIAWRTDNGPFTTVDDLLEVAGIGEKTLEGLRSLVTV